MRDEISFVSFELEVSLERLCGSNIIIRTRPISLITFLERILIRSLCSFASSAFSSLKWSTLTALLFLARREKNL